MARMRKTVFIAVFLGLFAFPALTVLAEDPRLTDKGPVHLTGDSVTHNSEADVYTATGNVVVTRGGERFSAEKMVFDRKQNTLAAKGEVTVQSQGDILTGESMLLNMDNETGRVHNGELFMLANRFTIQGETVEKTGQDTYSLENGSITSCPGDPPDWRIKARSVNVRIEGYGYAKGASLHIKGVPVFYLPYFVFPAKTKRSTGLLTPQFGQGSRKGVFINQPLFIAPAENWDVTLYDNFMAKRGNQMAGEFRLALDEESRVLFLGTYLHDRQVDEGAGTQSIDWGYTQDDYLRPNEARYWLVGKADKVFSDGTRLMADLDVVSDQDYLREFQTGYFGFDAMDRTFTRDFHRDIDDYDVTTRTNRLHAHKAFDRFGLASDVLWCDDVIARRHQENDFTVQTLPSVLFGAAKQRVLDSPLFFQAQAQAAHFYSEDGVNGSRLDFRPGLSLPFFVGDQFQVEPSAAFIGTLWNVDTWKNETPATSDTTSTRQLYELGVSTFSEYARVFDADFWGMDRIRHAVIPRLSYDYIPETDPDEYPDFDGQDLVEGTNQVTLSLTNTLTTRKTLPPAPGSGDDAPVRAYSRRLWLELSESFDINEAREDDPALFKTPGERQPFSPVEGRLEFLPVDPFSLNAEARLSVYGEGIEYSSVGAQFFPGLGRRIYVSYNWSRDYAETVYLDGQWDLGRSFSVYGNYERDLMAGSRVQTQVGLIYKGPCWSVDLSYTDEPGEVQYAFRITLEGLGRLGGSANPFD